MQGEGETKIMKRINGSAAHSKGSHVIVGNDSDIILMSLMCPVSKLYILSQQTKGRSTKFECISMDALNMLQSSDVLNGAATPVSCAVLCCVVLCCAVLCCAVLCCAVLVASRYAACWAGLAALHGNVSCMTGWVSCHGSLWNPGQTAVDPPAVMLCLTVCLCCKLPIEKHA